MEKSDEGLASIIVPGPELREKVDNFASRLSELEKRKADEMVAKVLASGKRNQYLFVDSSHIFYPYFLSKLSEYRNHPELRPEKGTKKAEAGAAASGGSTAASTTTTTTTTTTKVGGIVRTVGGTAGATSDPRREELLRQAEQEAKRYQEDPFPSWYSLDLKGGTVEMPALVMDILSCTAQYAAKYGDAFLNAVQSKQRNNPAFRFLLTEDVRHDVFEKLVESYRRILNSSAEETESRLEKLESREYVLGTLVEEKTKYAKAAVARRKAALLTDDELRAKLQWGEFKVVKSFTLNDLLLDGAIPATAASQRHQLPPPLPRAQPPATTPATASATTAAGAEGGALPPTTLQPPGGAPVFTPVFMSSSLVHSAGGSGGSGGARPSRRAVQEEDPTAVFTTVVEEHYTPSAVAPVRRGVDFFVDDATGRRVSAGALERQPKEEAGRGGGQKHERDGEHYGLASEEEMARELRRRATES